MTKHFKFLYKRRGGEGNDNEEEEDGEGREKGGGGDWLSPLYGVKLRLC